MSSELAVIEERVAELNAAIARDMDAIEWSFEHELTAERLMPGVAAAQNELDALGPRVLELRYGVSIITARRDHT